MSFYTMKRFLFFLLLLVSMSNAFAQLVSNPKVLIVIAHPDDETTLAVTTYKITHDLKGIVDLALITDGQGGYRNTALASQYYDLDLTDPVVGRAYLPGIRKQELMNAGRIMGIRNYFFFDQIDDDYTLDPKPYIGGAAWDIPVVEKQLEQILSRNAYDFVLILLPTEETHGHHKSAGLLALRAVKSIKSSDRPIVLGGTEILNATELPSLKFQGLPGYPETRILKEEPVFTFDRAARFGFMNLESYKIVHDWAVAEYKSQGDLQNNMMSLNELEAFLYFDLNGKEGLAKTRELFEQLKNTSPAPYRQR